MKGDFDKKGFVKWQVNAAKALATVAAVAREDGSKDEYLKAMALGAGVMTGMCIVRDALESGKVPGEAEMAIEFCSMLERHLASEEALSHRYDMATKED